MVGVPRSKGCLTCRKRKVACDQTRPECKNCQKRGVSCEGYARYPTILQYTGSGLKKREPFEEAISSAESALVIPSSSRNVTPPFEFNSLGDLPRQLNGGRVILDQVGMTTLDSYFPHVGSQNAAQEIKRNWMWMMLDLPYQGRALQPSIAALCFARTGLVNKDEDLMNRGRTQYAIGLQSLQKVLQSPDEAFQEWTLAAMRILSIYELSSMPGTSIAKAYVHEEGMIQWCVAAGPECIRTEFALEVFHDVRWCIMNRAIDFRQESPLGSEDWKTLPWRFFLKDSLQRLFDLGFELAVLLAALDDIGQSPHPEDSVSKRAQLSLRCSILQDDLDDWHRTHWTNRSSPASSEQSPFDAISIASSPGNDQQEFSSVFHATNIIYFWLFKMTLNDIAASTALEEEQSDLTFSSLELAVNIVSSASYFLDDATGWLGPQRLFFPLRKAMALLTSKQSPFVADAQQAFGQLLRKLKTK